MSRGATFQAPFVSKKMVTRAPLNFLGKRQNQTRVFSTVFSKIDAREKNEVHRCKRRVATPILKFEIQGPMRGHDQEGLGSIQS